MARHHGPDTLQGLLLIRFGVPLREAARIAGVAASTLVRARKGQPALRKGRPKGGITQKPPLPTEG